MSPNESDWSGLVALICLVILAVLLGVMCR